MEAIICKNDLSVIIDKLQEYLTEGHIKGMRLVDSSDQQVVILVDDKHITQERANDWWDGFKAGIG